LRIFYENQNPVDMHTSIMGINTLQNIKTVGDSWTNHVSISGWMNRWTGINLAKSSKNKTAHM
jgi:hypothetical protein